MQGSNLDAAPLLVIIAGGCCVGLAFYLAFWGTICYFVSGFYKAIPPEHRKMEPGQVWLLLIPFFNIVWNFFVYLRLSESLQSYFNAKQDTTVGDCNRTFALIYCIIMCFCVIPYLGVCAALVGLILLIVMLVKFAELKNRILANGDAPPL